jgi:hypothetical protein
MPRNEKHPLFNPIGTIIILQEKVMLLEKEVQNIRVMLAAEDPTPEVSEIKNRIAYNEAMAKMARGDKRAMKRFVKEGGYTPK